MIRLGNILLILLFLLAEPAFPVDNPENCWNRILSPNGKDFLKLNIDSNQVVYAGSWGDGLFRKDITWKEITGTIGGKHINVVESGFRDSVFVSVWGGDLYISPDKGDKWNKITDFFRMYKLKCLSVYKNGFMIAGTYGYGVYKTYDAGRNWNAINYKLCWRDINCVLAYNDSVYFAGSNGGGLYKTTNAGSSWVKAGNGITCQTITDIRKNINNIIYVSTLDCGIFYSADLGKSWQKLSSSGQQPESTNNFTIVGMTKLFAATNYDGVYRYNPDTPLWEKTDDKRVNSGVNSIVSNSSGYLYCSLPGRGIHYSNDGNSWSDSIYSINKRLSPFLALKDSIVISGNGSNDMFYSKDFGNSWTKAAGYTKKANSLASDSALKVYICTTQGLDTSRYDFSSVNDIAFFRNKNVSAVSCDSDGDILAGLNLTGNTIQAALFISRDGGSIWDSIAASEKSIRLVSLSPVKHIYYTDGSGLKRSADFGDNWENALNNSYTVNDIKYLGLNNIYIATDKGLLISSDTGRNFRLINYVRQKPSTNHAEVSVFGGIWVYLNEIQTILYSSDNGQNWSDWTFGYVRNVIEDMASSPHGYLYITSASIFRAVAPGYLKKPLFLPGSDLPDKVNHNTTFRWNNSSDPAELYNIQVSEDNFSSILENSVTAENNWQICIDLKQKTKYYIRVRGKTNSTYSLWSETLEFTTTGAGPELISPGDKSIGHGSTVTFTWKENKSPYRMQIARDPEFSDIVSDIQNIPDELQIQKNLNIFTQYYWRVSAFRTGWSDIWSFTTKLAPPKLLEPLDSSQYLKQTAVLKWETAPGAETYRVQVSDKFDFSDRLEDFSGIPMTSSIIDISDGYKKYFWRVKAFNQFDSSEWSKAFMFYTSSDSPILIYPGDNAVYVLADTTFRWDTPKNSVFCRFQISTDSLFKEISIVYDSNFIDDKEIKVSVLDYGWQYYWRVRYYSISKVNSDTLISAWSDVKKFRVEIQKVTLLNPADKSAELPLSTELVWEPVNCKYYYLQVSTKEDFSSDVYDKDFISESHYLNNRLEYGTKYYWRAKAKAPKGEGTWSDTWSFSTKPINSVYDVLSNGTNLHVDLKYLGNNLVITTDEQYQAYTMEIFDIGGARLIKSEICNNHELDLTGFIPGSYLLRISTDGKNWHGWFFRL